MPPVVVTALVSAAVTAGAYAITVGAITSAVVTMFVATFVLSLASAMLMPKPKMPTIGGIQSSMDERKQMIKDFELVKSFFKYSDQKTKDALRILTKDQIDLIKLKRGKRLKTNKKIKRK